MNTDRLLLDCPACGSQNRIPLERIGQTGRCGRCRAALEPGRYYASAPVELTEGTFDRVTRGSATPMLVDFWAGWCAPCRVLAPVLEQLAEDWSGRILVGKVDTEAAPLLSSRFGIQAIPTLVLLRSGIEVDRIRGAVGLDVLKERLSALVG